LQSRDNDIGSDHLLRFPIAVARSGDDFTNILHAANADPKSTKKIDDFTVFFALSGSAPVKAARKTLMKLTPALQYFFMN